MFEFLKNFMDGFFFNFKNPNKKELKNQKFLKFKTKSKPNRNS